MLTAECAEHREFVSQMTAELFYNDTLQPLFHAVLRDGDTAAGKLYEQLRYDIECVGRFVKVEDRALRGFADGLQDETITSGIASAVVSHARLTVNMESKAARDACVDDSASTAEDSDVTADSKILAKPAHPKFELDSATVEAILNREAYNNLTPRRVFTIIRSKRYIGLGSHVLEQVVEAYEQRLSTAIGTTAIGEDGEVMGLPLLQKTIHELAATPPLMFTFARYGTEESFVRWDRIGRAPELVKGFCRLLWKPSRGMVRYIDIEEKRVQAIQVAIALAPRLAHFAPGRCPAVEGRILKRFRTC